jgi:hypothetical protein
MLGLESDGDRIASDPVLPPEISELSLRGIQGGGHREDVVARL